MFIVSLLQAQEPVVLTVYLATLNTAQVCLLAWIGSEQHASTKERRRRRALEDAEG